MSTPVPAVRRPSTIRIATSALVLAAALLAPAFAATAPLSSADDLVTIVGPDGVATQVRRCGTPSRSERVPDPALFELLGGADCSSTSTHPTTDYDPGTGYLIDVWVHVLHRTNGTGDIPDAEIRDQIAVLNEDFRAIPGSLGAPGNDVRIFFRLAGVTRTANNSYYNDAGSYYDALAVDPHNYLNIYTNSCPSVGGSCLGYVPFLPTDPGAPVGEPEDRVVVLYAAFGRDTGISFYDLGRSATHEVGHYLGLEHTFSGSCGTESEPGCYSSGDLLCDTEPQETQTFGCPIDEEDEGHFTCSGARNPIENYMNYTDDLCMWRFTVEQNRRMRCAVEFYRPDLGTPVVFYDGFEGVGLAAWSASEP